MSSRLSRKQVRIDPRVEWFADVRTVLAPMSGITDRPFRDICRDLGAHLTFTEFSSAAGLTHDSEATWRLIDTDKEEGRTGIQIFGNDPGEMAAAAGLLGRARADILDLNFGCPAKKVVRKCGGSALLADLPLLEQITREVIAASPLPVSAKIRSGWDKDSVNYEEVGQLLQELGCCWVTLHSRTRAEKFGGHSDWDHIARLVDVLDIPVVGNGDVIDGESYTEMVRQTACHAVMIGRGAIGNPWIFREMAAAERGAVAAPPTFAEMCEVIDRHVWAETTTRDERVGNLVVRKHIAKCFKGFPGAAALRRRLFETESGGEMMSVLREIAAAGDPRLDPVEEDPK